MPRQKTEYPVMLTCRVPEDLFEAIHAAAMKAGRDRSDWVRSALLDVVTSNPPYLNNQLAATTT